jgi:N-acetylmuramoyl-L-alanine amidase
MVLTAAAHAVQTRVADVIYTYRDAVPQRGFRLGDECFVPVEGLSSFGWSVSERGDLVDIKAEGNRLTLPSRYFGGQQCVPLRRALDQIGAGSSWLTTTDTLEVYAPLRELRVRNNRLSANSAVAIKPSVALLTNPTRVIVDLAGARITRRTDQAVDGNVRVSQWKPNTVRLVLELDRGLPEMPRTAIEPSNDVEIDLSPTRQEPPRIRISNEDEPLSPQDVQDINSTLPPRSGQLPLTVDLEGPTATLLSIRLPGVTSPQFRKPDPSVLEVTLSKVQMSLPSDFQLATEAVTSVSTRLSGEDTVVVFQLARPMGAEVWADPTGVQIQLLRPNVGNGRLAGKVVVVDPGHGGHDGGAKSGGVREKDLNLIMGKLISAELAAQGATVIMTRKTDVFLSLSARAAIANKNKADFFISTHINSTGGAAKTSGTITFHHKGQKTSRLLAECIQREIAKVNQIPNLGVWSDGRIYQSGFAVLRATKMPGVLLELGFINHPRDRARMITADFQHSVAAAVVKGLRVFLGDAETNE